MPRPSRKRPPAEVCAEDSALAREAVLAISAIPPVEWMARYAEPLACAAARSAAAQAFANEFADRVRSMLHRSIRALDGYRRRTGWTPSPAADRPVDDPGGLAGAVLAGMLWAEMVRATQPAGAAERQRLERERDRILAELGDFVSTLSAVRAAEAAEKVRTVELPLGGPHGGN